MQINITRVAQHRQLVQEELDLVRRLEDILTTWQQSAGLDASVDPNEIARVRKKLDNVKRSIQFRLDYLDLMEGSYHKVTSEIEGLLANMNQHLKTMESI